MKSKQKVLFMVENIFCNADVLLLIEKLPEVIEKHEKGFLLLLVATVIILKICRRK